MRNRSWATLAGVVAVAALTGVAAATPSVSLTSSNVSVGRFAAMNIQTTENLPDHQVKVKTMGESDVYVVSNTFAPGGSSGWHTHPGPSLITVKSGTITTYDGDDPTCTPIVYTAGMGFVDEGGDHVHMLANKGTVDAVTIAVQFLPAGAVRRIDAPDPGHCG